MKAQITFSGSETARIVRLQLNNHDCTTLDTCGHTTGQLSESSLFMGLFINKKNIAPIT